MCNKLTNTKVNQIALTRGEISVSVEQPSVGAIDGCRNPLVSVVGETVVIIELFEVRIRATDWTVQHFGSGASAKALNASVISVCRIGIIGVGEGSNAVDCDTSAGCQASHETTATRWQATHVTLSAQSLVVLCLVLKVNSRRSQRGADQDLCVNVSSIGRDSIDLGSLFNLKRQGRGQHDSCVGLAETSLHVDPLCSCKAVIRLETQLLFDCLLIQINGILKGQKCQNPKTSETLEPSSFT